MFKVIIFVFFNDGKLCWKINIVVYSLKSLNVKKKILGFYIYLYYVGKVFYIGGFIYEWKLIGSVIYCLEFKMLMKLMFCICV